MPGRLPTVLITRPEPEASAFGAELQRLGYRALIEPVLNIVDIEADLTGIHQAVGLLITSKNGIRSLSHYEIRCNIPLFAVGDATAETARSAGFTNVVSASGTSQDLAAAIRRETRSDSSPLFHICGQDHAGDLAGELAAAGYTIERRITYRTEAIAAFTSATCQFFRSGIIDFVTLFSPKTAMIFDRLIDHAKLGTRLKTVTCLCLSEAVAAATMLDYRAKKIAPRPDQTAFLSMIARDDDTMTHD